MGVREKSLRGNRKARHHSFKQAHSHPTANTSSSTASRPDKSFVLRGYEDAAIAAAIAGGYCREEQMEEILLRHIDAIYKEAISKIAEVYDEDIALRAVLRNGHCYGTMDVLTNIVDNAMMYINSTNPTAATVDSDDSDDGSSSSPSASAVVAVGIGSSSFAFSDIRQLEEYSLAGMICLLQEIRPELSRVDAMWCLLMSDLNVAQARKIDVPSLPSPSSPISETGGGDSGDCSGTIPHGVCGLDGGYDGDKGGNCSKRNTLSSAMKTFLSRNTTLDSGAGANSKLILPPQIKQEISRMASISDSEPRYQQEQQLQQKQLHQDVDAGSKDCDVVASVLRSLANMTLEEEKVEDVTEDHKEMILNAVQQIRDLELQVKERKEWAQKTAMQAALKLGTDLAELKILRMEREENQRAKKGKQTLEDSTLKRLSEMQNALQKASGQVDRANAIVKQLEAENAEIRAEMEASKLSESESSKACMEVMKREKKCLKRLSAWQKQKEKLQKEVADEKRKISQMQQTLNQLKNEQREAEERLRQEVSAKEEAIIQLEDERRTKEATEINAKRRQEALRQKIEVDFQRHKDDIKRLEEQVSRFSSFAESAPRHPVSSSVASEGGRRGFNVPSQKPEGTGKMSSGSYKLQNSSEMQIPRGRKCWLCMKGDALVVFLPCAHQILCINCNEDHKKLEKCCPNCDVQIEERIRVYGPYGANS